MLNLIRYLLTGALLLPMIGCIDFADLGGSERYKEDFHYSYQLSPGGTISVDNNNGSVEISGSDQNTVDISGTKYASTRDMLESIKIDVNASASGVRIRTLRPSDWHGNGGARYVIRVPRKAVLDGIDTTNGAIRVDDIEGNARLKSTNGSIRLHNVDGELDAHTSNGSVEAEDVNGNARLKTTNGSIKVDSRSGSLEAETSNGSITASLADPVANWPIRLRSTNGRIDVSIKVTKLPDVRAETSNSSITVHLPDNASAHLSARTSHENVSSDFDVATSQGGIRSQTELEGNIGSGGPTLDLSSTNGSIRLVKL